MDKLNIVQKTVVSIVLSTMVILVVVPILFFLNVAFSSDAEMSQFPKSMLPKFTLTVKVAPAEDGQYEIFHDSGDGHRWIITTGNATRLQNHFRRQYGVTISGKSCWLISARPESTARWEFTYRKDMLYNFKQFFAIVNKALPALKNSILVSLYTILISLGICSLAGYAMARYEFNFKETINVSLLIVRMFPAVGISIPMAILLIRFGLFDTLLGLALLYSVPNIALTAWITASIFTGISVELEEASLVFGATRFQTFMRITLPLAFPALAASSMYAFLTAWNDTISARVIPD